MLPLKSNAIWFGVVEDINDPEEKCRVRVRIYGIHTPDKQLLPTDGLPWAPVALPANNPAISGLGWSPNGLLQGSMVSGVFLDGESMQMPIIYWSLPGAKVRPNGDGGFADPDKEYPRESTNSDINVLVSKMVTNTNSPTANRTSNTVEKETLSEPDPFKKEAEDNTTSPGTPWMDIALGDLGVSEEANKARIREYHKTGCGTGYGEETAWCSAFVNFCLDKVGINGTRSAMARSFTNWANDAGGYPYGAIVVLRGSRGPQSGHVAFVTADKGERVEVIGGNQSSGGGRKYDTGGMVTKTTFPKSWVVATRFPRVSSKKAEPPPTGNTPVDKIDAYTKTDKKANAS